MASRRRLIVAEFVDEDTEFPASDGGDKNRSTALQTYGHATIGVGHGADQEVTEFSCQGESMLDPHLRGVAGEVGSSKGRRGMVIHISR